MNYRQIPRCNFNVSEIGLGCEHLEKKEKSLVDEVIGTALDGGINIMDVFMPQPEVRTHIGNAIRHVRQKIYLQGHIGATLENGQYKRSRDVAVCDEFIHDFLTRFQTDYIDIGMIHFVDDLDDWHTIETQGILEYALQLKQKGIIRAIGLSSHAPHTALKAVQSGNFDVLMFSVNPMFDLVPEQTQINDLFEQKTYEQGASSGINPICQLLYETCARLGVGITVMKTLAAGLLLNAETSPFGQPLTVAQCEHYALTRPGVASVLIGCASSEQVNQALQYEALSTQEKDYTEVLNTSQRYLANGVCMYCNHCLPCPQEIDIAAVHQYYDLARNLSEVPATIREHYLTLHAHASDCIACGACEGRCPFGVEVIQNMEKASVLFGI
ncbi:MAG: aldo/keto reductase [Anaerolineaceae bacterium]